MIWSDRHAVHPCTISLYDYGAGIPRGSAALKVDASRWWLPTPGPLTPCPKEDPSAARCDAAASPASVSVSHAEKLTVMRGPDAEVVKPCRNAVEGQPAKLEDAWSEECVWPIQLYLKDSIRVTAKYKTRFDLDKYPLDKHLLVADLELATNFATWDTSYTVDAPAIDGANVAKAAADFYTGSAWKVGHGTSPLHPAPSRPRPLTLTPTFTTTAP